MRIAVNTLYSFAQLGFARLASVVTMVALAWTQGPAMVGVFSLALTFHLLLTGWWTGLDDKVVREIARTRANSSESWTVRRFTWQTVGHYLQLRVLVSLVLLLVVATVIQWGDWYAPGESWFIILLLISSVTDNATYVVVAGYVGNERFHIALAIIALQTFLRLALTAVALTATSGLLAVAVAWLAASLLTAICAILLFVLQFNSPGRGATPLQSRWPFWAQTKQDWAFWTMGIVVILEYQLDVIILSLFRSAAEVGYYSIATTCFALVTLPVQAFRVALFPAMSRLAVGNSPGSAPVAARTAHHLQEIYQWSVASVMSIVLPCALLGFVFADPVIRLVFGQAMAPAILPTRILMVAVVVFGLNVPHSRFLLAANRQNSAARFIIFSASINILANIWLGREFGAPGAALARVISTTSFLFIAFITVRRFVSVPGWRLSMAPLTATAATGGFLLFSATWPWWLSAALAAPLYGAIWWFMGGTTIVRALRVAG